MRNTVLVLINLFFVFFPQGVGTITTFFLQGKKGFIDPLPNFDCSTLIEDDGGEVASF